MAEMAVRIDGVAPSAGGALPVAPPLNQVTSLNAATAVSNGTALSVGYVPSACTFVGTSSATLTAGTILLQGSIDNVNWITLTTITAATDFTAAMTKSYAITTFFPYYRAAISVLITGGNITMKVVAS